MRTILLRLLAIQGAVTLAIAIGFYVAYGSPLKVGSVFYGGAMAAVVSLLLAWRMNRARRPGAGVAGLYMSTLERMVFVAAAFVVAIVVLGLPPLALIVGFIGAEGAYLLVSRWIRRPT